MNKLNKNFNSNGVTVESMACTLTCGCDTGCKVANCNCTTMSNHYANNPLLNSSYSNVYNAIDDEVYEMHYLG